MKRYLLFSGEDHYQPLGGWYDCQGSFSTIEDAKAAADCYTEWAHIVDIKPGSCSRIVADYCAREWSDEE